MGRAVSAGGDSLSGLHESQLSFKKPPRDATMDVMNTANHLSDVAALMAQLGANARAASAAMAKASAAKKQHALQTLAQLLREETEALQPENERDLSRAVAAGLAPPMVDRLRLDPKTLETCAQGCEQLAAMPDVIGEISGLTQRPSGIRVGQMRVPLGVFGMIYESRPNVTIEAASLAIKSGNACILRGGSEAIDSNRALAALVQRALVAADLPAEAVQLVPVTDRAAVGELIASMPRGEAFGNARDIRRVFNNIVANHAVLLGESGLGDSRRLNLLDTNAVPSAQEQSSEESLPRPTFHGYL